jgi:hypothetical protein
VERAVGVRDRVLVGVERHHQQREATGRRRRPLS